METAQEPLLVGELPLPPSTVFGLGLWSDAVAFPNPLVRNSEIAPHGILNNDINIMSAI